MATRRSGTAPRKTSALRRRSAGKRRAGQAEMRRFRLAMENSADMIVLVDRASMRYIDVNTTICKLLGYSKKELLKMGPADVVLDVGEELARSYDALIADPSSSNRLKARYRRKDGTEFPFESRRQVFRSGKRWIIAAISRDITDQVKAEQALRESETRFRSLIQLSSDWYWEQDAELRFVATGGARRPPISASGAGSCR